MKVEEYNTSEQRQQAVACTKTMHATATLLDLIGDSRDLYGAAWKAHKAAIAACNLAVRAENKLLQENPLE